MTSSISLNSLKSALLTILLTFALALPLAAAVGAQESATPGPTFGGDFQAISGRLAERFVTLAEAIPGKHYSWRPAKGVRSVSEVLMHVAQANFGAASSVGAPLPPDLPQDLSKVTDKAEVVRLLKLSFQLTGGTAKAMASADFTQPPPGGGGMTLGGAMLAYAEHQAEHFGQMIAYARSVGVAPPWSR